MIKLLEASAVSQIFVVVAVVLGPLLPAFALLGDDALAGCAVLLGRTLPFLVSLGRWGGIVVVTLLT